ncbi:MFS transporter [Sphingomonas psychrotolerans]|uniref:Major facilitator superfamily (MFS) profile domain-containing protein n=1 Tax=Sphingomonas psychrotolerans TaxID=1327635 RepID=A0A2K8MGT9_9SPHN|nr:MFS transporter [Sphingomonas psychrotolerans]ATY33087.1 hypothetical protein CVN68_14870 [Sphingomonas psychrotolerans]
MGGFAIGTTEFATMSLVPYFARGLRIDEPAAGHVISAYALGVVVGAPLLAVLGARMARRTLLIVLMASFGLFNGLSALALTYDWMLVFRFLSGLPHGAYFGIAAHFRSLCLAVFAIGFAGALGAILQTRLMDVVGDAQGLAASLNHSAFDTANALGTWLGGLAIAAGWGWTSTGYVAAGLALGGFVVWCVAMLAERRALRTPAVLRSA